MLRPSATHACASARRNCRWSVRRVGRGMRCSSRALRPDKDSSPMTSIAAGGRIHGALPFALSVPARTAIGRRGPCRFPNPSRPPATLLRRYKRLPVRMSCSRTGAEVAGAIARTLAADGGAGRSGRGPDWPRARTTTRGGGKSFGFGWRLVELARRAIYGGIDADPAQPHRGRGVGRGVFPA